MSCEILRHFQTDIMHSRHGHHGHGHGRKYWLGRKHGHGKVHGQESRYGHVETQGHMKGHGHDKRHGHGKLHGCGKRHPVHHMHRHGEGKRHGFGKHCKVGRFHWMKRHGCASHQQNTDAGINENSEQDGNNQVEPCRRDTSRNHLMRILDRLLRDLDCCEEHDTTNNEATTQTEINENQQEPSVSDPTATKESETKQQ